MAALGAAVGSQSAAIGSRLSSIEIEISSTSTVLSTAIDEAQKVTSTELFFVSRDIQSRVDALEKLVMSQYERMNTPFQISVRPPI